MGDGMFKKIIICIIVLIIVGVLMGFVLHKQSKDTGKETSTDVTSDVTTANQITVYYFHSTFRCHTCNKMEKYTKTAVSENFKENKHTVFFSINIDEPGNRHFLTDYNLYTKSVVLVDNDGRWKNLDKIWDLVRDEYSFKSYITTEINNFIGE
jgi:archaellin